MGVVHGDAEVKHHIHTCPVTQSDGYAIGVIRIKSFDILLILFHIGTQLLLEGLIQIGDGVEGRLHIACQIQFQGIPNLFFEIRKILLLLSGSIELQIGSHIA